MRAQHLTTRSESLVDVVRRVVGVQGQDARATRLALRVRTTGRTAADVDAAIADRRIVRTWAMRGTLHLVAAEDLRWIVGLLGPRFAAADRGRRHRLGIDDVLAERAMPAVREVLAGRALSRAELVESLARVGIEIEASGQAPAHLVGYAAMLAVLCRGADRAGGEPTYVLVDEWLAGCSDDRPDDPVAELTRRYLAGHSPAAPADLATWSGLTLTAARAGFAAIEAELTEVRIGADPAWLPAGSSMAAASGTGVRLLGHFDNYLLAYRDRAVAVAPEHETEIQTGGGFTMPTVLLDGRAIGTWRQRRSPTGVAVDVSPFGRLPARALPGLRAEAADLARFLGLPPGV